MYSIPLSGRTDEHGTLKLEVTGAGPPNTFVEAVVVVHLHEDVPESDEYAALGWPPLFIEKGPGCLEDNPIERPSYGTDVVRDKIE